MRISLAAARVNKKMTQKEFAKVVGVTRKTVQNWEKGKTKPTIDKIEAICAVLGMGYDNIEWNG